MPNPTKTIPLNGPLGGYYTYSPRSAQPPSTTPDSLNCWPDDPVSGRLRVAQRFGLSKWPMTPTGTPLPGSAGNPVQALKQCTVTNPGAVGIVSESFYDNWLGTPTYPYTPNTYLSANTLPPGYAGGVKHGSNDIVHTILTGSVSATEGLYLLSPVSASTGNAHYWDVRLTVGATHDTINAAGYNTGSTPAYPYLIQGLFYPQTDFSAIPVGGPYPPNTLAYLAAGVPTSGGVATGAIALGIGGYQINGVNCITSITPYTYAADALTPVSSANITPVTPASASVSATYNYNGGLYTLGSTGNIGPSPVPVWLVVENATTFACYINGQKLFTWTDSTFVNTGRYGVALVGNAGGTMGNLGTGLFGATLSAPPRQNY